MAKKNGKPDQAGGVAFRRSDKKGLRICLIHKPNTDTWVIPKGFIDPGDTAKGTVLKEAREEAGLRGEIVGDRLGTYTYRKWGGRYTVAMYLMEVTRQDDEWDEMDYRERHWLSPDKALRRLEDHPARDLFEEAIDLLSAEEE